MRLFYVKVFVFVILNLNCTFAFSEVLNPVSFSRLHPVSPLVALKVAPSDDGAIVDFGNGVLVKITHRGRIKCFAHGKPMTVGDGGCVSLFTSKLSSSAGRYDPGKTKKEELHESILEAPLNTSLSFHKVRIEGDRAIASFHVEGEKSDELDIELIPSSIEVDGDVWNGFGMAFKTGGDKSISSVVSRFEWGFGDSSGIYKVWGHVPYGKERGFQVKMFESGLFFNGEIAYLSNQFESQAFTLTAGYDRTHLSYIEPVVVADVHMKATRSGIEQETRYQYGVPIAGISSPVQHHLFLNRALKDADYSALSWQINSHLRARAGLPPLDGLPIAMASRDNQINFVINWRKYADKILPTVKRLGFTRVFAGMNPSKKPQYPFEYPNAKNVFQDFRYFNGKAHQLGIKTILWITTCTADYRSELVREHPEWVVMQVNNTAAHYHNLPEILVMYPSAEYMDWLLKQVRDLRSNTDFDGVWLDSLALAAKLVDISVRDSQGIPTKRILDYVKSLTRDGLIVYAEGMTPFALSSYWVRKKFYKSYLELEYGLAGTSPMTHRPDSDFVSYFKAASYKCFPLFDIQPFIEEQRVYPSQNSLEKEIRLTNLALDKVAVALGPDAIPRTFSHGVYWISPRGMAVFSHSKLNELIVKGVGANSNMSVFNGVSDEDKEPEILPDGDDLIVRGLRRGGIILIPFSGS